MDKIKRKRERLEMIFDILNTDENERKFLILTDKGFKYLDKYKLILGFIEEFEL